MKTILAAALFAGTLLAQQPSPTTVLTTLTIKPGIERTQFAAIMTDEVKATVKLYLDGKIQQWYSRGDGKGVVFLMNVSTVAEAKALTEALPLFKGGYVTFDYMPLGPLAPLRYLIAQ